jgi:hypothetical protein
LTSEAEMIETARHHGTKPVYWSQEALRRAWLAMVQSRSTDLLMLAKIALEGAFRDHADLLTLLGEQPLPKPAPPPRKGRKPKAALEELTAPVPLAEPEEAHP